MHKLGRFYFEFIEAGKMTKEKTLSDKIRNHPRGTKCIPDWKVKNFIKRLKDEIFVKHPFHKKLNKEIDKLAGDKLT